MKTSIHILLCLLLISGDTLAQEGSVKTEPASVEAIRIGINYSLTGSLAPYGTWALNGATLAADQINSEGGVDGREIILIVEDNEGKPAKAVSAFYRLRNVSDVRYVATFLSSVALAIAPLANRDRVLQVDSSATTPAYSSPDDFTFRTGILATQLASAAAKILSERLEVKRLAALYIENDFGEGMMRVLRDSYTGKILTEQSFRQDEGDFRAQLMRVKQTGAQTVWMVGHMKEAGIILKQAAELGVNTLFFTDVYTVEGNMLLETAGKSANGTIYVAPKFDPDDASPVVRSFVSAYRKRHKEMPSYYAAQAYDAIMVVAKAVKGCSSKDSSCAKDKAYGLDFAGASGRIKFDRNGDVQKDVVLKQIRNNAFVDYQQSGS